jgi:hypothetical protein
MGKKYNNTRRKIIKAIKRATFTNVHTKSHLVRVEIDDFSELDIKSKGTVSYAWNHVGWLISRAMQDFKDKEI